MSARPQTSRAFTPRCLIEKLKLTARGKSRDAIGGGESIFEGDARWKIAERVVRSSALARATQLRDILLFIVRQEILTPAEPIREFDIAHRVLGRRSDFNPLDDNIVRVQMAHLRKKLDLYFSTEGKQEEIVITVALGSYKPVFTPRPKAASPDRSVLELEPARTEVRPGAESDLHAPSPTPAAPPPQAEPIPRRHRWTLAGFIAATVVAVALAIVCVALWVQDRARQRSLETMQRAYQAWRFEPNVSAFWTGFLDANRDTDIVLSDDSFLLIEEISRKTTPFYGYLNRSYIDQIQTGNASPEARFIQGLVASKTLGNTSEFKLAQRLMALDPLGTKMHLYTARQYLPSMVKQDNVILIGGIVSNPWGELFESQLNFVEETKFEGFGVTIVTNRKPRSGEQSTYVSSDTDGYCVVAYMPNPGQDGKVLLLQGTSSEATEAAGDFLLSEDRFTALRNLLHGPQIPYFEVLLKTSQVRGTPLSATIEAYRIYPNLH